MIRRPPPQYGVSVKGSAEHALVAGGNGIRRKTIQLLEDELMVLSGVNDLALT